LPNRNSGGDMAAITSAIERELHLLRESQKNLLALAAELGFSVPRWCCLHQGEGACQSCAAQWLVAHVSVRQMDWIGPLN
jgi:hypothetical protein